MSVSRARWALVASFALGACKATSSEVKPSDSALAKARSAPAASAQPKPKPWFVGGFSGQYQAKLAKVEITTGRVREWTRDDGKESSGAGKLTLHIADDGAVDGSSEGPLGASSASGKVEDDTLRVQLSPTDDAGLRGVLIANRDGDGFKGSIQASSGDSLRVREATVELKKQPD